MEIINIILLVVLCGKSLIQPTGQRVVFATLFSFSGFALVFKIYELSDTMNYIAAGGVDLFVLICACIFAKPTKFIDYMVLICLAFIGAHGLGLLAYERDMEPTLYNISLTALYLCMLRVFSMKGTGDGIPWLDWLRVPYSRRRNCLNILYKKA